MYSPLDEICRIGNSEYKSMKTLINSYRELESVKNTAIDDQTIHFWNLQLQFMEMSSYALKELFKSLDLVGMYSVNKHTTKIQSLVYCSDSYKPLSENDHNCLATHLALQLSGLA